MRPGGRGAGDEPPHRLREMSDAMSINVGVARERVFGNGVRTTETRASLTKTRLIVFSRIDRSRAGEKCLR
jgi:hypothetical protein